MLETRSLVANVKLDTTEFRKAMMALKEQGWTPGGEVQRKLLGYAVTHTVSATLHGDREALREGVSKIVDLALTSPTVNLSGPMFSQEDLSAARQEALEKAVRDAVQNAQAMARGAG